MAAAALRAFFSRHFSRLREASTAVAATLERGVVGFLDDFPGAPPNGFEVAEPRGVLLAPRALLGPRADFFPDALELEPKREELAPPLLLPLTGFSRRSSDAGLALSLRGVLARALPAAPVGLESMLDDISCLQQAPETRRRRKAFEEAGPKNSCTMSLCS